MYSDQYQRKTIPHPTLTLPLTPPSTPPGDTFEKSFIMDEHSISMSRTALAIDTSAAQRHTYSNESPITHPLDQSEPSSPLVLPQLLSNDDSPASSVGLMTPPSSHQAELASHLELHQMSQGPTPKFDKHGRPSNYPLLSPHHPLRKKMYQAFEVRQHSNALPSPTTPKGHPLPEAQPYFAFAKKKMQQIANPYSAGKTSYSTTLHYLLRIPRRFRPVLLVLFCLITFSVVYLQSAMSEATVLDRIVKEKHRQMAFGRRYTSIEGLVDINDYKAQATLFAQMQADDEAAEGAPTPVATWSPPASMSAIEFADEQEEYAALLSFVTSTTANSLPPLDPHAPLDPAIVLDFDPSHPNARGDLDLLISEMHTVYPLVLFGKMRDPWHREIKRILAEQKIHPAPLVIDVDQRRDHLIFMPLVSRLLGTQSLPQLVLEGKTLGSYHEILAMKEQGTLRKTLESTGAVAVTEIKKKKKGVKERERLENERILGPAPIQDEA